jgi:hypothetical protein
VATTCDRMGCSAPATVVFGADPPRMIVVMQLVDPTTLGDLRPGILCAEHADRMTVPIGWTLDDQRESTLRLFRVPSATPRPRRTTPRTTSTDTSTDTSPDTSPDTAVRAPNPEAFEQPSLVEVDDGRPG